MNSLIEIIDDNKNYKNMPHITLIPNLIQITNRFTRKQFHKILFYKKYRDRQVIKAKKLKGTLTKEYLNW